MTFTRRTAAERNAEIETLHQQLADQVEALRNSQAWRRYLAAMATLHRYSATNILLAMAQRPTITQLRGFKGWISAGRVPRKGTKAITILSPRFRTAETIGPDGQTRTERELCGFAPCRVFDIADTDPLPGADVWEPQPLIGEDPNGVFDTIAGWLNRNGYPVEEIAFPGTAEGYSTRAKVVIKAGQTPLGRAAVILHEAAHIALGHLDNHGEYQLHRGRFEVEAESVAFVLGQMLGLDISTSAGYVADWATTVPSDVLKETAETVHKCAHKLADALGLHQDTTEPESPAQAA